MAKPNRVMANMAKRSPVEQLRCRSFVEAQCVAEQKRAEGFDAKATQRRYGSRKNPGREYSCFVYEKVRE
jgi:hypothetical protein